MGFYKWDGYVDGVISQNEAGDELDFSQSAFAFPFVG